MTTACSSATASCPCGKRRRSRTPHAARLTLAGAALAACLATAGCVIVPVPLPGIKSGRGVNESTAGEITAGTPMADVLLRLGEPDSVSIDGRLFAYRFSRTWGAVFWAIGGAGAAQGGAIPVQYGEAVVIEFDDEARVTLAERRAGNWMDPRPGEEPLFYGPSLLEHLTIDGESVHAQRRVQWWVGHRPRTPDADRRPIGLLPWTTSMSGSPGLTTPGHLFLTGSSIWLRPAFATGTAATDALRVPRHAIEAIIPFDRDTPHELTLLLIDDGRALALEAPAGSRHRVEPSLATWLEAEQIGSATPTGDALIEGWVVWVSTKVDKGKPRTPLHISCLWLTVTGLRFENYDIGGKPADGEFLRWSEIERVDPGSRHRTIIGVQIASADIVCRDGRTLRLAQVAPVADRTRLRESLRAGLERGTPSP